jgi:hypothetical protein
VSLDKCVARFIGHRDTWALARYEEGRAFPPLRIALKLESLYRRPIAFLWPELYSELRDQVRACEHSAGALGGVDVH